MNENKQTVLTDEEIRAQIDECSMMAFPLRWINFARAIESAVLSKLRAAGEPVDLDRDGLMDLIAEHLSGTYHCTRVWSAWGVGTMSQDDFEDVGESDTPGEIADAIIGRYAAPQASAEVRPLSQYGYQTLFDAISAATWTTAGGEIEVSVQAFRDALKSAPAAEAELPGMWDKSDIEYGATDAAQASVKDAGDVAQCDGQACVHCEPGQGCNSHRLGAGDVDERAAFEAWATHINTERHPHKPEIYYHPAANNGWAAWQARAALAAQPAASAEPMDYERRHAIKEGERNEAAFRYFSARATMMDTPHNRRIFEAGFDRGYDAAPAAALAAHKPDHAVLPGTNRRWYACESCGQAVAVPLRADVLQCVGCKGVMRPVMMSAQAAHKPDGGDAPWADWMGCESRRPFVVNSLRAAAKEMRAKEQRARNAYRQDYMGAPCQLIAAAYGKAATLFEAELAAIDAAICAQQRRGE